MVRHVFRGCFVHEAFDLFRGSPTSPKSIRDATLFSMRNLGYSKFLVQIFSFKRLKSIFRSAKFPSSQLGGQATASTALKLKAFERHQGVRSQEGKPKVGLLLEKLVEKLKVASFSLLG